jgi:hypothetical protein
LLRVLLHLFAQKSPVKCSVLRVLQVFGRYAYPPGLLVTILLAFCLGGPTAAMADEPTPVEIVRVPDGGIQPQALTDAKGTVHLLFYQGEPKAGDLFYARRKAADTAFSEPIRVNKRKGSAIAMGTIRGGQMALGKNARVHLVWDGMGEGAGLVNIAGRPSAPLLYTRLNDSGTAFEPERNVITRAAGLDGGSSVAADEAGNVYVVWHAPLPGNTNGEAGRTVFVIHSKDEGKNFGPETPATSKATGACACCGLRAFTDQAGATYVLYRAATAGVNRDETLLVSRQPGAPFQIVNADPWQINMCPMSSAALAQGPNSVLAAWETAGQIKFSMIDAQTLKASPAISPSPGDGKKHPALAANGSGEILLVWTEGTGWAKGGAIAWQVYDQNRKPLGAPGHRDGLPVWSFPAAYAKADNRFVIIY